MNVNKKLDRFKQWAGERMGQEARTNTTDDFKALETEMNLRHQGFEKMHKSATSYVKSISKREEYEDREKMLPGGYMGSTMINHGSDFEPDSEFGNCLTSLGRANEAIARKQETYAGGATTTWLESLERSLVQMKEYQAARKKLDSRRLAYDASLAKMQKAKKEDFRVEEDLRTQKAKYEETTDDVYRRMMEIKEAEVESVADLGAFLDAELEYYDSCREILLKLKREWPASESNITRAHDRDTRRPNRSRSNTAHSYSDRFQAVEEELKEESRTTIPKLSSRNDYNRHDYNYGDSPVQRPNLGRSNTSEPVRSPREYSPTPMPSLSRVPTDSQAMILNGRSHLRPVMRPTINSDIFNDPSDDTALNGTSPDRYYSDQADSPATSNGSRSTSWSIMENGGGTKKAAPPPPPSRSKKPPPPLPVKRSLLSSSEVPHM
ncbi:BAR-domain-containing protein [Aulographum hederae CBS 113979]|uniref:BAR-domain-containing protein n=1 Tax=Aulographum hederae CBS 113979 TaxID=1176131 RepID=A0A6G1GYQ4_9PEZI|nr:BAR-domain-containing protein [Aulographum hederae CBS 113979]